jgi:hypothetical protein
MIDLNSVIQAFFCVFISIIHHNPIFSVFQPTSTNFVRGILMHVVRELLKNSCQASLELATGAMFGFCGGLIGIIMGISWEYHGNSKENSWDDSWS